MTKTEALSQHSRYIENALRHVFLAQLFKAVWKHDFKGKLHIYNNEVDDSGFDLVARSGDVTRHIQLKATHTDGKAKRISAHADLASAQGGCIVWMSYDAETLDIRDYRFFGQAAGQTIADISLLPATRTTRRDIHGKRKARLKHHDIGLSQFSASLKIEGLRAVLFDADTGDKESGA